MSNGSDDEIPKVWFELMAAISQREGLRKTLPIMEPSAPPEPPYEFHGFEVTGWVLGGMGMVLLGRDPKLDRRVALKLLQSSGATADAALIVEAKTLAKLSHPNVVTVYAVMEWEGGVFFVMEFIDGMNAKQWLERRPTWQEVLDVFIDAGEGLAAVHDKGIQHGDFKPANMLIGKDGRTRVADFGIADYLRVDDGDEPPTGRRAGTPKYMAPERLRGHRGDARSDQFSFCVALWRALHGWRPYGGETVFQLLEAIEAGEIRPGDSFAGVPNWLTQAVRKGLADEPDERYGDMHELLRALRGGPLDETAVDESDDDEPVEHEGRLLHAPATPAGAAPQRERWTYGVIGFLLAVVGGMGVAVVMLMRSPEPRPGAVAESVAVEPYHAVREAVAADDFAEAERLWLERESEWTDVQTLQIADICLERADALAPTDRTRAMLAALLAQKLAAEVENYGSPEARTAGGQLATEATKWLEAARRGAD
ncbi:MAG: serine/threonine-protein kinase [Enhygromyxa sp.]